MVTIGYHTPALTLLQNQFQGLALALIPHSFTTLLPIAMASPVHHMKITACSHVWCAQDDAANNLQLELFSWKQILIFRATLAYTCSLYLSIREPKLMQYKDYSFCSYIDG